MTTVGSSRRAVASTAIVVAAFAIVPFAGTVNHQFTYDDGTEVVLNSAIRSLRNVPAIFGETAWEGAGERAPIWRPLTTTTLALNHAAGALEPWGYHVVNVALHASVALLVLALGLVLRLAPLAAGAGAIVFAVHPVHVEAVVNVAGRKDLLATLFVLLGLLSHVAALRRTSRWWCALPIAAVAAALLSKENGVIAPGLFVAWDLTVGRDAFALRRRRAVALYVGYAATVVAYLVARQAVVGGFGFPVDTIPFVTNPLAHVAPGTRLLTAVAVLGQGLALVAWPAVLSPDYSFDAIPLVTTSLDPRFVLAALVIAVLGGVAVAFARRVPQVTFAIVWYAMAISPTANVLFPVGTIFGDRLLYLPSVALAILAGAVVARVVGDRRVLLRRAAAAVAVVAVTMLMARTVAYAAAWRDDVTLTREAVRVYPACGTAHEHLGAALMRSGDVSEAIAELETAVQILARAPELPARALIELGVAYERQARLLDAAAVYERLLGHERDHPDALWRLGVVHWAQGRREEAVVLWRRTVAVDPSHARAMTDLGIALEAQGNVAEAEAAWIRATEVEPQRAGAWLMLGDLYERRGELARAHAAWREFLERAHLGVYPAERERIVLKLQMAGEPRRQRRPRSSKTVRRAALRRRSPRASSAWPGA